MSMTVRAIYGVKVLRYRNDLEGHTRMAQRSRLTTAATRLSLPPAPQTNMQRLEIRPDEATSFAHLDRLNTWESARDYLLGLTAEQTTYPRLSQSVQNAIQIGAVWRLGDERTDWQVPDLDDDMQPIVPQILVSFPNLTAAKRAQYLNIRYSVAHIRLCARIFDDRVIVQPAVEWFTARRDRLVNQPRKSEGLDFVAQVAKGYKAYTDYRDANEDGLEGDALEGAAIQVADAEVAPPAPRPQAVINASEQGDRLFVFAAHALAYMARAESSQSGGFVHLAHWLGRSTPNTMDDFITWAWETPMTEVEREAFDELGQIPRSASLADAFRQMRKMTELYSGGTGRLIAPPPPTTVGGTGFTATIPGGSGTVGGAAAQPTRSQSGDFFIFDTPPPPVQTQEEPPTPLHLHALHRAEGGEGANIIMNREWCLPMTNTFSMLPVIALLNRYLRPGTGAVLVRLWLGVRVWSYTM